MKVLIHSADEFLQRSLRQSMQWDNHVVDESSDPVDAVNWMRDTAIDVAIVDCGLQIDLPSEISALTTRPPVLALTANDEHPRALAHLLDSGADDAMFSPFDIEELRARLRALRRRATGQRQPIYRAGRLSWDPNTSVARVDGREIPLTGKERGCFEVLVTHPGVCITKERFMDALYGGRDEPELKILDVFICKIRRKLETMAGEPIIQTSWGRGYYVPDHVEQPLDVAA